MTPPAERPRFLSEADCHEIAQRLQRFATGGGYTFVQIVSAWRTNVRWARNIISAAGEDRDNRILVSRNVHGAGNMGVVVNDVSDAGLKAAVRRAEEIVQRQNAEWPESELATQYPQEPFAAPSLFVDATYQLDIAQESEAARQLAQSAAAAGMLSAGYIEVSAHSQAMIGSWGYARYFQYTWAQYSVTVRSPKGDGSGWAGVDWPDWRKIDGARLSAAALDKCLTSRNPVTVEPGRYTTILEPQAVCDFIGELPRGLEVRWRAEQDGVFNKAPHLSKIGERIVDERITMSADPLDPDLAFPPFHMAEHPIWPHGQLTDQSDAFYHPMTWIDRGVLTNLWYNREYAITQLGRNLGGYNSGAFRMSGGPTSIDEMVQTTKRGLLVTRFDAVTGLGGPYLCRGYTRDGVWLIENGKITKATKNFMFVESVLFALNNVEQLGPAQRAFHPPSGRDPYENPQPVIVPPLKIRDFSFTALADAV